MIDGTQQTVAVTGGNGFLGSHIVDRLAESGQRVISLDLFPRSHEPAAGSVKTILGDLADAALVRRVIVDEGIEVVVHAAWTSVHETSLIDPAADLVDNLIPTIRLLEACREGGVKRLIFLSSGGQVYGPPAALPVGEAHPTHPVSAYGAAKLAAEKYIGMYAHLYGLESVILRPSVPYGPRQNPHRRQGAVSVFIHRALMGMPVEIWGSGETARDYFFVDDLCDAVKAAVRTGSAAGRILNLGGGRAVSLNELVALVEGVLETRLGVQVHPARAFDVDKLVLDCSLAKDVLGWQPRIGLEEGIRRTAVWIRSWFDS